MCDLYLFLSYFPAHERVHVFYLILYLGLYDLTPEMRVIHTGLMIGQCDQGRSQGPLVHQF